MSASNYDKPIDMTLRMWSDHIPLDEFLRCTDIEVNDLHITGNKIIVNGQVGTRVAARHFASVENAAAYEDKDISRWLINVINLISMYPDLIAHILAGRVEALIWIAVFGREFVPMPCISSDLVRVCLKFGLKIMLENYTEFDMDGLPKRIWLSNL